MLRVCWLRWLLQVRKRMLHIIRSAAGGATAAGGAPQQAAAILAKAHDLKSRSEALRCLGRAVGRQLAEEAAAAAAAGPSAAAAREAAALLAAVQEHADPGQPDDYRSAAVDALVASGLLRMLPAGSMPADSSATGSSAGPQAAELAVAAWHVLLQLLEDDAEEVRGAAAQAAEDVMHAGLQQGSECRRQHTQQVLRDCLAHLAARCLAAPAVLRMLCALVFQPRSTLAAVVGGGGGGDGAEPGKAAGLAVLSRRLFDREPDNPFEEPLLLAQLSAELLADVGRQAGSAGAAGQVAAWAGEVAGEVQQAVEQLEQLSEQGGYVGGISNHHELFVGLVRALLALWVAATWRSSGRQEADGFVGLQDKCLGVLQVLRAGRLSGQLQVMVQAVLRAWQEGQERVVVLEALPC